MIALTLACLSWAPAFGEEDGAGSTRHHGRAAAKKSEPAAVKANDRDYKSALDRLPAQKYDPWGTMRPATEKP
jgi:hypothetical protein